MDWMPRFLAAVAQGSMTVDAARFAGISTSTVHARKARDADFAEAWRQAKEDSIDVLEAEAIRRAVDGVNEPVIYQGQLTPVWAHDAEGDPVLTEDGRPVQARNADGTLRYLTVNKKSDALLQFVLKGRRMDVFGTERKELTGAAGAPLMDETARKARLLAILSTALKPAAPPDDEPLA